MTPCPLVERATLLAEQRAEEGYMVDVKRQPDGTLLLVENHCPICVAAKACQGFCKFELNLFRDMLGSDAKVAREEHIVAGARRCAYRIPAKAAWPRHHDRGFHPTMSRRRSISALTAGT